LIRNIPNNWPGDCLLELPFLGSEGLCTDVADGFSADTVHISGYAVVWRRDEGLPLPGQLEMTKKELVLRGGTREREEGVRIPYHEILGLERDSETRSGRCRAITVFSRSSGDLLIASIGGVGILSEIWTALQQALG
jgi:hypothetical protein